MPHVGGSKRGRAVYPLPLDGIGPLLCYAVLAVLTGGELLSNRADAAEAKRPIRIGALTTTWGSTPMVAGLRDGLQALGYRDRKDFEIGVRFTRGEDGVLPEAARQLVQYDADLIFVGRADSAKAAKEASTRVPIVFASVSDPVGAGLVESFARPGGNITGVSDLGVDLGPKRMEVFRSILPGLKRVLFPYDATDADHMVEVAVYRSAAQRMGIDLVERPLRTEVEAKAALSQIQKDEVDGVLTPPCCVLNIPGLILEAASEKALPTMFRQTFWVERGALASYGPDYYASGRQAARLVDKILKGMKPADIPVEVNSKFEFAINRKVAEALMLTIAPEIWFRADKVIR